jgi:hypothetical protein
MKFTVTGPTLCIWAIALALPSTIYGRFTTLDKYISAFDNDVVKRAVNKREFTWCCTADNVNKCIECGGVKACCRSTPDPGACNYCVRTTILLESPMLRLSVELIF